MRPPLPELPTVAQAHQLPAPGRLRRIIQRRNGGLDVLIETGDDGMYLVTFVGRDSKGTRWLYTLIANHEAAYIEADDMDLPMLIVRRRVLIVDMDLAGERLHAWAVPGHELPASWLPKMLPRARPPTEDGPPSNGAPT